VDSGAGEGEGVGVGSPGSAIGSEGPDGTSIGFVPGGSAGVAGEPEGIVGGGSLFARLTGGRASASAEGGDAGSAGWGSLASLSRGGGDSAGAVRGTGLVPSPVGSGGLGSGGVGSGSGLGSSEGFGPAARIRSFPPDAPALSCETAGMETVTALPAHPFLTAKAVTRKANESNAAIPTRASSLWLSHGNRIAGTFRGVAPAGSGSGWTGAEARGGSGRTSWRSLPSREESLGSLRDGSEKPNHFRAGAGDSAGSVSSGSESGWSGVMAGSGAWNWAWNGGTERAPWASSGLSGRGSTRSGSGSWVHSGPDIAGRPSVSRYALGGWWPVLRPSP